MLDGKWRVPTVERHTRYRLGMLYNQILKPIIIILTTVQQDATKNSLFIIQHVHSTCFGCQPHPSSGVHKTVTTVSGTVQLSPSNVAKLAWPR